MQLPDRDYIAIVSGLPRFGGSLMMQIAAGGIPPLMASFAFIFGCLPLWFASGSGAVARRVLGSTVIGGMIAASDMAIFLIPVIFYVIERLFAGRHYAPELQGPAGPGVSPQITSQGEPI